MIDLSKISKDRVYRKKEVADLLGITVRTLDRWIAKGFPAGAMMYGIRVWNGSILLKHINRKTTESI